MAEDCLFDARCERRDGGVVVVASGEIDLSTSPQLRAALRDPEAQAPRVVLDLRGVTFMDSSALGVIVGQHKRARDEGFRFAVAAHGAENVERILELAGLTGLLDIVDGSDELLAR
jgi:anti-anti-sigma factor